VVPTGSRQVRWPSQLCTPDKTGISTTPADAAYSLAEVIEIELPRGYRVRVGSNVNGAALRLVLDALERR
jgi:hypothetical protein